MRSLWCVASGLVLVFMSAGCSIVHPVDTGNHTSDSTDQILQRAQTNNVRILTPERVSEFPWDPNIFTQGLEFAPGTDQLLVSSGRYGKSRVGLLHPGESEASTGLSLPDDVFAEGVSFISDILLWLVSWENNTAYLLDTSDFSENFPPIQPLSEAHYSGQGWGLSSCGDYLVMSQGSDTLSVRRTDTFEEIGDYRITLGSAGVDSLNELECVTTASGHHQVYANIWFSDSIVRIDMPTDTDQETRNSTEDLEVTEVIDASSIVSEQTDHNSGADVLNGIAWHEQSHSFFITGKYWDQIYEVRFV